MANKENATGTGNRTDSGAGKPRKGPASSTVTNPHTGAAMVAQPAPDRRAMIKAMIDQGHSAAYATNFVEEHLEKEQAHGTVYVDPATGYVMRVKEGAAADTETEA